MRYMRFAAGAALLLSNAAWGQATVQAPGGFVPRQALSFGAAGDPATAVDETHPLPISPRGRTVTYTDRSGTIAAGGTAQTLAPANAARGGFLVQNVSSGDLWITSMGTASAAQPSLKIGAGQLYEFPQSGIPASALSIVGGATGQAFTAREW